MTAGKIKSIRRLVFAKTIFPALLFFIMIPGLGFLRAQELTFDSIPSDSVTIDHIIIIGNRVTREKIIRRELDIHDGLTLDRKTLDARLKRNQDKIINTSLFQSVNISPIDLGDQKADIIIRVVERWYLFPYPIFQLADRNFNDWWINHHHDIRRIEWGLHVTQYNVRGMNETLKLTGQLGYTKRFTLSYIFPYINKKQKTGLNFYFDYGLNKNTYFRTDSSKLIFFNSSHWLKEYFLGGVAFTLRKSFYTYHTFGAGYAYNKINDTISELNPGYFNNGKNRQAFFNLYYYFLYDNRDVAAYPLHGTYFLAEITKNGIGLPHEVNLLQIGALYDHYLELPLKFYLSIGIGGRLSFPRRQPYNMFNSFGYGQFTLRGYELYVIEGQHIFLNQWTIRRRLFKVETDFEDYFASKQVKHFKLDVYLKGYADLGYVKNYENYPSNSLFTNQLLYGYGIGIDLFTIYDLLFRWEYSFNKIGEHGLVLGLRKNF